MAERIEGLSSLGRESRKLGWENEDETLMLKMFILLYADDATICAESAVGLQQALDAMCVYCDKWSLRVNVEKNQSSCLFERENSKNTKNFVQGTTTGSSLWFSIFGTVFSL